MSPDDRIDQMRHWDTTYQKNIDFFGQGPSELGIWAVDHFRRNKVTKVLELGCGQGRDTWLFLKEGLEVTALDYSESGICQMKERAGILGVADRSVMKVCDARKGFDLPSESFDAVYSHMFFTMELTEKEILAIMDECRRVLRPGGVNVYSVRNDHDPHFEKGPHRGEDMWQNPMGFVVHFFSAEKITRLAKGWNVELIREFDDTSPPFTKKLYEVVLRKPKN